MRPLPAVGFVAAYNVIQNAFLNERGYVTGNLGATGLGLAWARKTGLSWGDLGLEREDLPAGLQQGAAVSAAAYVVSRLIRDDERLGAATDDSRLADLSDREVIYRLLVRFPLGTALFEEVWFRGALPAALRQNGAKRPELASAAIFAAWHVIPTLATINANPKGRAWSNRRKTLVVISGSAATGLAGLAFSTLRNSSSSLAAPWVAHAAINGLSFWAAVRARRHG